MLNHLFYLSYVQEPFIIDWQQLIVSQNHQDVDCGQAHLPAEKLCYLEDQKVNLHRASWGQCIVGPTIHCISASLTVKGSAWP